MEDYTSVSSEADLCKRAAGTYQCGQEKDPSFVSNLQGKIIDRGNAEVYY
jgi:hypothetical protein